MKPTISKKIKIPELVIHKVFFLAILLESSILFLLLALHPSSVAGRAIWLYSVPRFLELSIILTVAIFAGWCLRSLAAQTWRDKLNKLATNSSWNEIFIFGGFLALIISRLAIIILQAFSESPDLRHLLGYATHLRPLAFFFSLIGFEITIWALCINKDNILHILSIKKQYFNRVITLWGLLSITVIFSIFFEDFMALQKITTPYSPVLEWGIFLGWVLATIIMMFFLALREPRIHKKQAFFIAFLIAVSAFLFQISLQSIMRPYAKDSFYFQEWSSEAMIQTVSLKDLQRNPLETLNNIHTKPPGFDAIRAILVHLWPAQDALGALLHVDFLLYKLWTVLYSILGAIAFLWLSQLTEIKVALIATFILLLHPATLLYSTLLDSNFLTTFLVFVFCYLMWKIKNEYRVHLFIVVLATLALFFTRAIFQYPFIIVVGSSLFLLRIQKRKVLVFLLITASIVGLYGAKQYHKFGILSASSFTGVNLNRSVGNPNFINYWTLDIDFQEQDSSLPKTLTRIKKVDGSPNFNHIQYLAYNQELIEDFKEYIFATPVSKITISYWENVQIYFEPSSQYNTEHAIIDRIPWKGFYDRIFSTPVFPGLLLVFGIPWLKKVVKEKDYLASIGLVLPGLYIFFITVLFEKGENMRFKFFLEPILFIFLVSQLYDLGKNIRAKLSTKST